VLGAVPAYGHIAWEAFAPRAIGGAGRPLVVQAVIRSERGVLLSTRRELRGWELPGGEVRPGESDETALVREVREETGLDVAPGRLVGVYERSGFRAHTARVYACRAVGGALRPSRETPDVAWFAEARLPDAILPWFRVALDDALAECAEPVHRRSHQGLGAILAGARIDLGMRWNA
jgi:ADP-ribose pyrophosphatase YjhB (NUDIX family)